jgi:polyisoprenoid-binding protein YceI
MSSTATEVIIPASTWVVDPVHTSVGFQVTDTTEGFSTASGVKVTILRSFVSRSAA